MSRARDPNSPRRCRCGRRKNWHRPTCRACSTYVRPRVPAALRFWPKVRITAELERKLAAKAPVVKVARVKPVPVVKPEHVARIEAAQGKITDAFQGLGVGLDKAVIRAFGPLLASLKRYPGGQPASAPVAPVSVSAPSARAFGHALERAKPPAARAVPPPPTARAAAVVDAGELGPIRPGERKMLGAIASLHPEPVDRPKLAVLTGYGIRHGTFTTYLPNLKKRGLVVEENGLLRLTGDGMAEAGDALKRGPRAAPEVRRFWENKLRPGEWKMLTALFDGPLDRPALAEKTGYGIRHGTFTTYLPTLKKLGVVIESGGMLTVHPSLLEGDAAAA